MLQFSETIIVENEVLNFAFNRIYTKSGEKFFVVVQKGRKFFQFNMKRDEVGKWKITEPAPEWLKLIEENLSNVNPQYLIRLKPSFSWNITDHSRMVKPLKKAYQLSSQCLIRVNAPGSLSNNYVLKLLF